MSIKTLYNMSKEEFNKLSYKERYDLYLRTPEWKEIADYLKNKEQKCICCGDKYYLQIHHLTYDRVKYSEIGYEFLSDIVVVCNTCHLAIHQGKYIFIVVNENEYEDFREVISHSDKYINDNIKIICVKKSDIHLSELVEKISKKKTNKSKPKLQLKLKIYAVYGSTSGKSKLKKAFINKSEAEDFIKDYPKIPWPYLKIKEIDVF